MRFGRALSTAIVVTLAAQTLDILAHLATNVTIHIPYILAKTTVISATLLVFNWWVGMHWRHGIVSVFAATTIFYLYYVFTEPTLDRTVFTLDEQVVWIFIHFAAVYAPYLLTLTFLRKT